MDARNRNPLPKTDYNRLIQQIIENLESSRTSLNLLNEIAYWTTPPEAVHSEAEYPCLKHHISNSKATPHSFISLPETGYLRISQIIGNPRASPPIPPIIPVSRSTWWAGVKSGRYPKPSKALGPRITVWRVEDIRALIERVNCTEEKL